jgi:hypothetical protein
VVIAEVPPDAWRIGRARAIFNLEAAFADIGFAEAHRPQSPDFCLNGLLYFFFYFVELMSDIFLCHVLLNVGLCTLFRLPWLKTGFLQRRFTESMVVMGRA